MSSSDRDAHELSDREQLILRLVVDSFIRTGAPVGSRALSKAHPLGLSPASIRNTMADLEDLGFLDHPHTSAGRVPTETGYRLYVDDLMDKPELPLEQRRLLFEEFRRLTGDRDEIWRESSRLLGRLSNLLGLLLTPKLSTGVFLRLDVIPLSSTRAMFVITIRSGLVKTIVLEVDFELETSTLTRVVSHLNERLSGLTLEEIRESFAERVRDLRDDGTGLIGVVLKHADVLFDEIPEARRLNYSGAQNILIQPEFQEPAEVLKMFDLLEHESVVVQLLEKPGEEGASGGVQVRIGAENEEEKAAHFSIVTAKYRIGNTVGTIGVIGPTRMEYRRLMALVDQMGLLLSEDSDPNLDAFFINT